MSADRRNAWKGNTNVAREKGEELTVLLKRKLTEEKDLLICVLCLV